MKRLFVLIFQILFISISLSAQTPDINLLRVVGEGGVQIRWNNVPEADSGAIFYRDQYTADFSEIHSFDTMEVFFTHANAGANYKKTWYFVVNFVASDTLYSDTIQTMFLQAEALNEVCIQLSWNIPFEGVYILERKYQGVRDKDFHVANTFMLIDTVEHCINDYTYLFYNSLGQTMSNETVPLTDAIQPVAPHLDSVSVIDNQYVILGWQRSVSEDCAGYEIYKQQESGSGWDFLKAVNHPDSLYAIDSTFSEVCSSERVYCVVAVDYCGNSTPINETQHLHNLVFYPPLLDTCEKTINLVWTPFDMYDLTPQLGGYRILYSKDGEPYQLDGIAPPNAVSYAFNHPERNSHYLFKIQAINNLQTVSCSSCEHEIFAALPKEPEFGFIRYASVKNSYIDVCFMVDTQASSPTYEILRSTTGDEGTFQTIKTIFPSEDNMICVTDSVVDVRHYSYYYKLHSLDSCSHILEAPLTVQSILLTTETNTDSKIELNWNEYTGFIDGLSKYLIYSSVDGQPFMLISETFDNTFIDESTNSNNYTSTLLYQVAAVSDNMEPDTAWSNSAQYLIKSFTVFFPNAFRPTGSINNIFRPVFAGIDVDEYQLLIYNRWGFPIFSTTTPGEGWNGKTEKGNSCDSGTYIYQFIMSDKSGNRYHKTGCVILL